MERDRGRPDPALDRLEHALRGRGHAYGETLLEDRMFRYILKTGAGWHGPIGRAVIDVRLGEGLTRKHVGEISPAGFEETEGRLRWFLADFEPTEDVTIRAHRRESCSAAVECLFSAERFEECAAACRRLIAFEQGAREGKPDHGGMERINSAWLFRPPYVIWERMLVRCLVRLGRIDEARREAPAAVAALRLFLEEPRRGKKAGISKLIEIYERFAAGSDLEDGD